MNPGKIATSVRIDLARICEMAKYDRTGVLQFPSVMLSTAGWTGVIICIVAVIMLFGTRPTQQRALEATTQMERLTAILSRAKTIAPSTAHKIAQLMRQPDYDCKHMKCYAALERRNLIARYKLKTLLGKFAFPGEDVAAVRQPSRSPTVQSVIRPE